MPTAAIQNIAIRIGLIGAEEAARKMDRFGGSFDTAVAKIKNATSPASRSLLAVNVVTEQLRYGMENLSTGAGTLGLSLSRLGPAGLALAATIGALSIATYKSVEAFKESEQSANRLATALRTTEFAAGLTAREISKLAEDLEGKTLFSDEQAQDAATALLFFGNIAEDTFKRALRLSLDYAQANQRDVVSSAQAVGRALQDPTEGLKKLEGVTTELTLAEKDLIKGFVETNNIAAAQNIILDKLAESIAGQAEGANQGLTGATNSLGDEWDKLLESFGKTVAESSIAAGGINLLKNAITSLREAVAPTREEEIGQLQKEIRDYETSLLRGRLDAAFGLEAPGITAARKRLKDIAEQDRKEAADALEADRKKKEKDVLRDNEAILAIEREYQQKRKEASQTEREKLVEEAKTAKARIDALFRDDGNADAAKNARAAVDSNLKERLAKLDRPAIEQRAQQSDAARKRAIEEINRGILQTKPSFDVAKQALDDWKTKLIEDLGGASAENQKYIDLIEQIYNVKLKDIYNKSLLDSKRWEDGASRALRRYADEATDAAKDSERVFTNSAQKIEDALVDAVSTGEFSMKKLGDLIQDIQQEILRSFIRQNITGPIAAGLGDFLGLGGGSGGGSGGGGIFGNIFGSLFGSSSGGSSGGGFFSGLGSFFSGLFHEGGVVGETLAGRRAVPAHAFIGARRYHNGLMPDEFPAILQRGETVLPKNTRMGGNNIVFNITTPNAQSFMDSRGQIMAKFAGEMQRSRTRNG